MNKRPQLRQARRLVVKIGSALLTNDGRGLDEAALGQWVDQMAGLIADGVELVVVSSGAVAVGMSRLGWSRRPVRRVRKALANSLLTVGLWRHDPRIPRLVGFARCTGDGVFEATVWDVAVHPLYQGSGLGSQLMVYVLEALEAMGTERVSLFADPGVVNFYQRQGWELEPQQHRCAFWYAS